MSDRTDTAASDRSLIINPESEAILIVDIVEWTRTSVLYGGYAVGQRLIDDLRHLIQQVDGTFHSECRKFVGDGYLLTFYDSGGPNISILKAIHASVELAKAIVQHNRDQSVEHRIRLRFALHFGEVNVVDQDREGLHVAYTFRLESIDQKFLKNLPESVDTTLSIPPDDFPQHDYMVLSENAVSILTEKNCPYPLEQVGIFILPSFLSRDAIYLLRELSTLQSNSTS